MHEIVGFLKDKKINDDAIYPSKLSEFMKIGGISKKALKNIYSSIIHIKDTQKLELASILLDRWLLYNIEGHDVYVKHIASGKLNILYQVILSGSEWDGVYSLSFRGPRIVTYCEKDTLIVETEDNFESVWFIDEQERERAIHKTEFETEEEFLNEMLQRGYVDEEEIEIYYNPEPWIKDYIAKKLPKVVFKEIAFKRTGEMIKKRSYYVRQKAKTQAVI